MKSRNPDRSPSVASSRTAHPLGIQVRPSESQRSPRQTDATTPHAKNNRATTKRREASSNQALSAGPRERETTTRNKNKGGGTHNNQQTEGRENQGDKDEIQRKREKEKRAESEKRGGHRWQSPPPTLTRPRHSARRSGKHCPTLADAKPQFWPKLRRIRQNSRNDIGQNQPNMGQN